MQFPYPLNQSDYQLLEPYKYICESSGKGFRNLLIQAFDYWLNVGPEKVKEISSIVQGLHMASLLYVQHLLSKDFQQLLSLDNNTTNTNNNNHLINYSSFLSTIIYNNGNSSNSSNSSSPSSSSSPMITTYTSPPSSTIDISNCCDNSNQSTTTTIDSKYQHGTSVDQSRVDDIEDNSKLRRGAPVTHSIYGVAQTINSANFVYFLVMDQCNRLGNSEATSIFIEELIRLHRGQGYDILWRDTNKCPTEDDYMKMVSEKTGGLFRLGLRLLQAFSTNKTDYSALVENLGYYYQIRDDYINLSSSDYQKNKSFCEDITEGKFSFPIIHAIHRNPMDTRLSMILKQRTESVEVKQYATEYIKNSGSLEYTKTIINEYREKIILQINQLGGNPFLSKMIETLDNSTI
eukprot:gene2266-2789_t